MNIDDEYFQQSTAYTSPYQGVRMEEIRFTESPTTSQQQDAEPQRARLRSVDNISIERTQNDFRLDNITIERTPNDFRLDVDFPRSDEAVRYDHHHRHDRRDRKGEEKRNDEKEGIMQETKRRSPERRTRRRSRRGGTREQHAQEQLERLKMLKKLEEEQQKEQNEQEQRRIARLNSLKNSSSETTRSTHGSIRNISSSIPKSVTPHGSYKSLYDDADEYSQLLRTESKKKEYYNNHDDEDDNHTKHTKPPLVVIEKPPMIPKGSGKGSGTKDDLYLEKTSSSCLRVGASNINLEVDFYSNPTILSRLILNEKYSAAMKRVFDYPKETAVWVCAKRLVTIQPAKNIDKKDVSDEVSVRFANELKQVQIQQKHQLVFSQDSKSCFYSLRQLPIHIACVNLRRTHDSKTKKFLNDLIANLIFANPEGAHEPDHNGRYPIHEAIWHGATAETISLFLLAKPSCVSLLDVKNRTLQEINKHSPSSSNNKDEIQRMLELEENFWKQARKEATFRLLRKSVKWPSDSSSVGSLSVLVSSKKDDDTILSKLISGRTDESWREEEKVQDDDDDDDEDDDGSSQGSDEAHASSSSDEADGNETKTKSTRAKKQRRKKKKILNDEAFDENAITPLSWDQLETRAIASEQLLMEMNEKFYEMSKKVEALSILGQHHHGELIGELTILSRENNILNDKLFRLEVILAKISDIGKDVFSDELRLACSEAGITAQESLIDISSVDSTYNSSAIVSQEKKIREKLGILSQNHFTQRERIRKLAHFVGKLVMNEPAAAANDFGTVKSALSLQTKKVEDDIGTCLSELSSRSAKSHRPIDVKDKKDDGKDNKPKLVVDMIPVDTMQARYSGTGKVPGSDQSVLDDEASDVEVVDNLSDVFRFATTENVQISPRGNAILRRVSSQTNRNSPAGSGGKLRKSKDLTKRVTQKFLDQQKKISEKSLRKVIRPDMKWNELNLPPLITNDFFFEPIDSVSQPSKRCFTVREEDEDEEVQQRLGCF